ncbi:CoA transferase [Solimonas sp. K1W22B-7]|uniref:CaiB/BaiF CoA-transferase family protein n=1 Tax=Solimonas sp. K1W22B-7 TaxID=2303331 RepID=UPI000E32D6FA|nr:CoA transferase [Solimonas sp. K1W22B-7]AXQ28356.1 CoA transferase [Solimonas sp. K1W22B-7]
MSALATLRVIELSGHVAAAFCGKLMAGFGAEVLQLPAPAALPGFELNADEQAWFHTAKQRIALDISADAAGFTALLKGADVLLDGWGHGVLAQAGFDAARLRAINPVLVVVQITPFGQDGPQAAWKASDLTLYGLSGLMQSTGSGTREPLNARPRMTECTAGMNAYCAAIIGLLRRERDGCGARVDLSIRESAMENYEAAIAEFLNVGKVARRNGDEHNMVPWRTYPCADGEAAIIGGPIRHWLRAAPLFEAPELLSEKLQTMGGRMANRAETQGLMQPFLMRHGKRELFHLGQKHRLAWSYLASMPEALEDPQHAERRYFIEQPRADGVAAKMPGAPFRSDKAPWRNQPAPAQAAAAPGWEPRPAGAGKPGDAPLAGLRVLDFTHDWAGPHAARFYADYGAEVIKIEYPQRLDGMRGGFVGKVNEHPRFWQLHRGKKSVTLDLKRAEHRAVLDELVRGADLVIENSRPGVMEHKGYGYERLRQLRPDIVMVAMSAFGASGPYAGYCGYGGTLEAISGLQSLTAYDAQGPAYRVREMDVMNGIMGICAGFTALWQRSQGGGGQWIDLSECETTAWFVGEHFAEVARSGRQPVPQGNRHPLYAPQGCYAAEGQDRWLLVSVRSDGEWQALAGLLGAAAEDARYATAEGRRQHHDALDALISAWSAGREVTAAVAGLQAAGVTAGYVCSSADLAADPQLAARGWFQDAAGTRLPGLPFRMDGFLPRIARRGPDLGADNAGFFAAAGVSGSVPDLSPELLGTAYTLY